MRLHCKEHGYMDEKTGPMAECPYCEIDRLTAELAEATSTIGRLNVYLKALESQLSELKQGVVIPTEPTDEMIRLILAVEYPATYRQYLRHPDNGPKSYAETEARIERVKKQYSAIIATVRLKEER